MVRIRKPLSKETINDEDEITSKQRDNKEEASSKGPTIAGVSMMIV